MCFEWNGVISLLGCIHQKIAFHAYLGRMYTLQIFGNINEKYTMSLGCVLFFFANYFFPSKFLQIRQSLLRFVQSRHAKTFYCFPKSVKQKSHFSQTFEWQEILRRKASKSYDKTAVWNGLEYKTKKIVNLILKNAMLKATIKVYSELLVTDFYAQISCSVHSKFVKVVTTLIHLYICAVWLVYVSFPASTKLI